MKQRWINVGFVAMCYTALCCVLCGAAVVETNRANHPDAAVGSGAYVFHQWFGWAWRESEPWLPNQWWAVWTSQGRWRWMHMGMGGYHRHEPDGSAEWVPQPDFEEWAFWSLGVDQLSDGSWRWYSPHLVLRSRWQPLVEVWAWDVYEGEWVFVEGGFASALSLLQPEPSPGVLSSFPGH